MKDLILNKEVYMNKKHKRQGTDLSKGNDFKKGKHFAATRLPSLWRPPCACGAAIKIEKDKK